MGLGSWLFGAPLVADALPEAPKSQFAVDGDAIPPQFFGLGSYSDPVAPVGKVTRATARQVPAVKRARDIICGTLGTIPLQVVDTDNVATINALLDQPEDGIARSVTMTRLFEDLLYDGIAWWRVKATNYRGYPTKVERIDCGRVSQTNGKTYLDGRPVTNDRLIQFLSPNGALLSDGARAIRTLIRLEAAAATQAESPVPAGYFSPLEDIDPMDDEETAAFLARWDSARQKRSTAYVSAGLKYDTVQFSPKDLQLIEARQHAVLEVARLTGIDAEDLSVSTTSRTYFNGQDRRQQRIADVLSPFATAVTDRLRMEDVTPRGYEVRADFSQFLRADDSTRLDNYAKAKALGLLSLEDIADREGLPVPEGVEQTALPAPDVQKEITA